MKSPLRGKNTSRVEVQDISKNGIQIYVKEQGIFFALQGTSLV